MGADVSPSSPPPWWKEPWVRRVAAAVLGGALLASCPFWPKALQPICAVVSDSIAQQGVAPVVDGGTR